MTFPVNSFTRKLFDTEDQIYELVHNLDVSGCICRENLHTDSESKVSATAYQPVWTTNVRLLLSFFSKE